jgi:hypothetical protein
MSRIKIHYDMPQWEVPHREERLRKTFFMFLCTNRFYLVFLLSAEALLEADPNEFWFGKFYVLVLLVFLLYVQFILHLWCLEHSCAFKCSTNPLLYTVHQLFLVKVESGWCVARWCMEHWSSSGKYSLIQWQMRIAAENTLESIEMASHIRVQAENLLRPHPVRG